MACSAHLRSLMVQGMVTAHAVKVPCQALAERLPDPVHQQI